LIETVNEIQARKLGGILLKLDLRKRTIGWIGTFSLRCSVANVSMKATSTVFCSWSRVARPQFQLIAKLNHSS
jgi:hypothetical protein